ncbi:hypothetical protein [Isoptericola croceus]|uniref:hypothetical protein n=1 Tax=Isoptericola croceus TaxID=3031406 RepID=UPI0023F87A15|nr:hypothetical protein [Isoptericola croceus]
MTNPAKIKGDQTEREALAWIATGWPHLLRPNAMRMLGAGRRDDIGDLSAIDDVVIQVKASNPRTLTAALRAAAHGAAAQRVNAAARFEMGLTKYPNARGGSVRWLATSLVWPGPVEAVLDAGAAVSKAVVFVRDEAGPARTDRVAVVHGRGLPVMYLAPAEAWMSAFEHAAAVAA